MSENWIVHVVLNNTSYERHYKVVSNYNINWYDVCIKKIEADCKFFNVKQKCDIQPIKYSS